MKMLAALTGAVGSLLIIYGSIAQGSRGMTLFAFGLTTLLVVPATTLLCRLRLARGKGISYGTAVAGAFAATLLTFVVTLIRVARFERWTSEYWACLFIGFVLWGIGYVLPALGVVRHYQQQAARTEARDPTGAKS